MYVAFLKFSLSHKASWKLSRTLRGRDGYLPKKGKHMQLQDRLKCECSWLYHERASHWMSCRLCFLYNLRIDLLLEIRKMDPTVFKIGRSQAIKNQWVEMGKQLTRKLSIAWILQGDSQESSHLTTYGHGLMCIHNSSVHTVSRAYSRTHELAPFLFSLFQVTIDDGAMHSSTLLCQVKVIWYKLMLIVYAGLFKRPIKQCVYVILLDNWR
ncbi:hypothetical protein RHSIM_Rhsim03G0060100 [Rhododendron simsii]|uniref:Uncharacterized protein n=1 Tax=Rhododendron simsii TaxID=118357 RepID=A0A834LTW9_RHOSS|nr:hypothetical protein RHSIM_Rhsim03G0060100 [Rhododendron simsii]